MFCLSLDLFYLVVEEEEDFVFMLKINQKYFTDALKHQAAEQISLRSFCMERWNALSCKYLAFQCDDFTQ